MARASSLPPPQARLRSWSAPFPHREQGVEKNQEQVEGTSARAAVGDKRSRIDPCTVGEDPAAPPHSTAVDEIAAVARPPTLGDLPYRRSLATRRLAAWRGG
jgi:hypothetical protein